MIDSLYNAGAHNGSEIIKIKTYKKYKHYSNSGYLSVGSYVFKSTSTMTPVELPGSMSLAMTDDSQLKTYGWVVQGSNHVMSKRIVTHADRSICDNYKIWFKSCICTVPFSGEDGCNIVNGSPLILVKEGREVLIGLRYTYKEACNKSGFPVAFTRVADALKWIKDP